MSITATILHTARSNASSCKTDCHRQAVVHTGIGLAVFAFLLLLFSSLANAAPVIVIEDGSDKISLNNHIDILDNPEQALAISDIAARQHQFAPVDLSLNSALKGFSPHIWLRFSVVNNSNKDQRLWLTANPGAIQSLSLYQWIPQEGARKIEDSALQRNDRVPVLKELLIPAQTSASFLIDAHILGTRTLDLHLLTPTTLLAELRSRTGSSSFALGLLSMLTLICGFITLYRQSTLFLYHSAFILAITGIYMIGLGLPRTVFDSFAHWQDMAIAILLFFTTAAGLLCIATYLGNTRSEKPCQRFLHYANYLNIIFGVLLMVLASKHSALMVIPAVLALPLILASLLFCYRQHNDWIALGIALATLPSGILLCKLLLLNFSTFSLDLLIDPALLYLMVATVTANTILFMIAEHRLIVAEFGLQQQALLDQTRHQAQNDLLQAFSGDIQTPLSGIMGMAELLKSSSLSTEQRANVDAIRNSGQLLLNRIADTHYRIQFEQNSENVRQSPFELNLLMENCINTFQLTAAEKNIELILQIQPDVPAIVKGDEYRLRQCLFRLLDNAIAHTEQGEVAVKVSKNANDNDIILFSVCDTGRGISEEQIASLGKPDAAGTMKMGLNNVTEMLRQLKSELLIDSSDGEGSTFSFALELAAVETGNERNSHGDTILKYKKLLIVDDNKTSCKVLKQQATSWGMTVAEAHSGNEALAMYRAKHNLGETFDAIILDYDMPQVSGIEVAEKITLEARENQPVIIMLATLSQSPPDHIAKQAGVDNLLSKPVSQKMLRLTLCNLFQMRQKSARITAQASLRRLHVLVADDNDVIRSVISKMMESLDVDYKMVSDGKLAVDAAKKEYFDVILMDCEMPFMNGFEATEQIHRWQQEKHQPQTPVIALTAYTLSEHKNKSKAAGMVDYLEKPINIIELEAVLQRFQS